MNDDANNITYDDDNNDDDNNHNEQNLYLFYLPTSKVALCIKHNLNGVTTFVVLSV